MLRSVTTLGKGVVRKVAEYSETATPTKGSALENNESLLSPDMIPPTPPQPKRMKLDEEDQSTTKLKPRALIPVPINSCTQTANIPLQVSDDLRSVPDNLHTLPSRSTDGSKESKAAKNRTKTDFYGLGRHKVVESEKTGGREIRLSVLAEDSSVTIKRICILRDFWVNTVVEEGDIVHIHADWLDIMDENGDSSQMAVIDGRNGLIVVRPDLLISGTSVVSSLFCSRKAVLSERFKGVEPTNQAMLIGTIVHGLLQKALIEKCYQTTKLHEIVDSLLESSSILHDLYGAYLSKDAIRSEILKFVPMVQYFISKYIHGKNVSPPEVEINNEAKPGRKPPRPSPNWSGSIDSICDIEENIWSPWLGIKGRVDLTVKVRDRQRGLIKMPLELKTGRSSFSAEHKGQVTLYSMMMTQNESKNKTSNAQPSPGGLLLYLKDGAIQNVPAGHNEKQALVQLRNEMVRYLTAPTSNSENGDIEEARLPERIDRIKACESCPLRVECTIYQIAEEGKEDAADIPLTPPYDAAGHLSPSHRKYFLEWSRMLRLECEESQQRNRGVSSIWCIDPKIREAHGSCLSYLKIEKSFSSQAPASELSRYSIKLVPSDGKTLPKHVHMQRGENVVLSTNSEVAIATGCILEAAPSHITFATDRDISNWDRNFNVLHLDKLEYQGGQSLLYSNLSRLMANNPTAAKLRKLIIDRTPPTFKAGLHRSIIEKAKEILGPLNTLQKRAVLKSLTSEDYCLIHGLPGTGKTSLIVAFIRLAVSLGHSILLTSYTHSAVDNVLLKLCQFADVDFVRIGREHRTHPNILPYSAEVKAQSCKSVEDVERIYSVPVVATTCLSVGHPALMRKTFDFCIVDEAAQALQLAVIGPLTAAKRFVLVGDPLQLPPVVQSRTAKSMGMDKSLFDRLSTLDSNAVVKLKLQYRMCGPVNHLANKLTYNGDLECGNEVIEHAELPFTSFDQIEKKYADRSWVSTVIQPGLIHAVMFVDTSLLGDDKAHRQPNKNPFFEDKSPVNYCESFIAIQLIEALNQSGLPFDQIGVIAPYQTQVQHLKRQLIEHSDLEINTVDQYQGRDKEAIIYSCTKSDPSGDSIGKEGTQTILHDLRRLTVAVTRAKHKLVIIGDGETLQRYPPFAKLLASLEKHQRYYLCPGKDGFKYESASESY